MIKTPKIAITLSELRESMSWWNKMSVNEQTLYKENHPQESLVGATDIARSWIKNIKGK